MFLVSLIHINYLEPDFYYMNSGCISMIPFSIHTVYPCLNNGSNTHSIKTRGNEKEGLIKLFDPILYFLIEVMIRIRNNRKGGSSLKILKYKSSYYLTTTYLSHTMHQILFSTLYKD